MQHARDYRHGTNECVIVVAKGEITRVVDDLAVVNLSAAGRDAARLRLVAKGDVDCACTAQRKRMHAHRTRERWSFGSLES